MTSLLEDLAQSLADKTGKAIAIEPAGIRAKPKSAICGWCGNHKRISPLKPCGKCGRYTY